MWNVAFSCRNILQPENPSTWRWLSKRRNGWRRWQSAPFCYAYSSAGWRKLWNSWPKAGESGLYYARKLPRKWLKPRKKTGWPVSACQLWRRNLAVVSILVSAKKKLRLTSFKYEELSPALETGETLPVPNSANLNGWKKLPSQRKREGALAMKLAKAGEEAKLARSGAARRKPAARCGWNSLQRNLRRAALKARKHSWRKLMKKEIRKAREKKPAKIETKKKRRKKKTKATWKLRVKCVIGNQ